MGNDNPVGDGKFECEARFKMAPTAWPAIWMSHPYGAANDNETYYEVDICEYWHVCSQEDDYYCNTTYHYPESQRDGGKTKHRNKVKLKVLPNEPHEENGRLFTETDWNKFSCTWDENSIKVFVNDTKVMEIENDGDKNHFPIDSTIRTFNIVLSMQYDSTSLGRYGCVLSTDDLPLYMDVKNVKVYKKI